VIEKNDIIAIEGYHEAMRFRVTSIKGDEVHAIDCKYDMPLKCNINQATIKEKHESTSDNNGINID
jgi:hypothetical protein